MSDKPLTEAPATGPDATPSPVRTPHRSLVALRIVPVAHLIVFFLQPVLAGIYLSGDFDARAARPERPDPVRVHGGPADRLPALRLARMDARPKLGVRPTEYVEVAVRFTDHRGLYLIHRHNLEHEDMAMMATFQTVQRSSIPRPADRSPQ